MLRKIKRKTPAITTASTGSSSTPAAQSAAANSADSLRCDEKFDAKAIEKAIQLLKTKRQPVATVTATVPVSSSAYLFDQSARAYYPTIIISEEIKNLIQDINNNLRDQIFKNILQPQPKNTFSQKTEIRKSIENHLLSLTPFLTRCVGEQDIGTVLLHMHKDILSYLANNQDDFLHMGNVYTFIAISLKKQLSIHTKADYDFNEFIKLCGLTLSVKALDDLAWDFFMKETENLSVAMLIYLFQMMPPASLTEQNQIINYLSHIINTINDNHLWEIQALFINMTICVERCLAAKATQPALTLPTGAKLVELCFVMAFKAQERVSVQEDPTGGTSRVFLPLQHIRNDELLMMQLDLLPAVNIPIDMFSDSALQMKYRDIFFKILKQRNVFAAESTVVSPTAVLCTTPPAASLIKSAPSLAEIKAPKKSAASPLQSTAASSMRLFSPASSSSAATSIAKKNISAKLETPSVPSVYDAAQPTRKKNDDKGSPDNTVDYELIFQLFGEVVSPAVGLPITPDTPKADTFSEEANDNFALPAATAAASTSTSKKLKK